MDIDGPQNRPPHNTTTPGGAKGPWIPDGVVIGIAILMAVTMVAGAVIGITWYQRRDTDDAASQPVEQAEQEADGSDPTTSQPNDFELVECPAGTEEAICEAAAFVQNVRQRPFKTFPEVELLESAAFNEALLEDYDEGREDIEHAELAFKALGMIEPEVDLFDEFRNVLSVNVVGFYDPENSRLVVRGEDLNLYVRSVLVHELVHAFDDQWFDLDRDYDDDEQAYGFAAIAEGNATRVDQAWEAQLSDDDRAQFERDRASSFSLEDLQRLQSFPRAIIELQTSPYTDGPNFLNAISATEADIDSLLTEPPVTSERILHPEISEQQDPQVTVDPPDRPNVVDDGKLGEVVIRQLFGAEPAAGWEGDSYVVWSQEGKACIAADILVETEQDLNELTAALENWKAEQPGRSSATLSDPDTFGVSFTNC